MCLYVLGSAPALSGGYCTWSAAVLTLPPSRVCNSSGSTRKRIIDSTRTRLRQCVPSSLSPGWWGGVGGGATVRILLSLPEKKDGKRRR